ncbi:MAG: hypothetical protein GY870_11460 [archaeon]|nr:hypothetical protein [archaeon]
MNSRDLTLDSIKGEPEKIPFNPFIMHLAASYANVDYKKYCQEPEVLADAQIKISEFLGIDHVNVSTDAYREASAWGVEIDLEGHTPVAKPNGELEWKEFDSIETPDLLSSKRIQTRVESVRLLREKSGSNQCVIGWIEAPFAEINCLFGMMNVLKIGMKKDWIQIYKKLINRILPIQLEFAKMQIEAGADIIGAGDSAISQIGPKRYKEGCLELTQKLFKDIEKQVPVLYHTCGDNSSVDKEGNDMLKLIARSGASIVDLDYQVDLKVAKKKIGKQICIRGNTNTSLLGNQSYSAEQVAEAIISTIKVGKPDGMYMYAAGCELPWEPIEMAIRNLSIAKALNENLGKY